MTNSIKKRPQNELLQTSSALNSILKFYPRIAPESIELFAPVFYPIAILEISFYERTYEDFEVIQLYILRCFQNGLTAPETIASMMGLSPKYVANVLKLLRGFGHIENDTVTSTGQESIRNGTKITEFLSKQKFQADPLNSTLIRLDTLVSEINIYESVRQRRVCDIIEYPETILDDTIIRQVSGDNKNDFRDQDNVLFSNYLRTDNISCDKIKYADAFLLSLYEEEYPIIITRRQNEKSRSNYWQPLFLPNEKAREKYDFSETVPISTKMANERLVQSRDRIKQLEFSDARKNIKLLLTMLYNYFDNNDIMIVQNDNRYVVKVNSKDFPLSGNIESWKLTLVYDMLWQLSYFGKYHMSSPYLNGHIVEICSDDSVIMKAVKLYVSCVEKIGDLELTKRLKKYCDDSQPVGDNLFDYLIDCMIGCMQNK